MQELWKPIKLPNTDYSDSHYEVSNLGRVRDAETLAIKDSRITKDGHCIVALTYGRSRRSVYVSRLVAVAFIPNPGKLQYVHHRDGNKSNNRVDNLYWSRSSSYKSLHGKPAKPIHVYTRTGDFLGELASRSEAERVLGVSGGQVSRCCSRHIKDYLGLIWRFAEDDELYKSGMVGNGGLLVQLCKTRKSGNPRGSIRQYSFEGVLIGEYTSSLNASATINIGNNGIIKCCNRVFASSGGFIWRYIEDDELYGLPIDERKRIIGQRYIRQYDSSGKLVGQYLAVADITGLSGDLRQITMCCNRYPHCLSYKGYIWRYSTDDELAVMSEEVRKTSVRALLLRSGHRGVKQYNKDGSFVNEYPSVREAKNTVKCVGHANGIIMCCNGVRQSAYGYVWRWAW